MTETKTTEESPRSGGAPQVDPPVSDAPPETATNRPADAPSTDSPPTDPVQGGEIRNGAIASSATLGDEPKKKRRKAKATEEPKESAETAQPEIDNLLIKGNPLRKLRGGITA